MYHLTDEADRIAVKERSNRASKLRRADVTCQAAQTRPRRTLIIERGFTLTD